MDKYKWCGLGLLLLVATLNWLLIRHEIRGGQQMIDIEGRVMLFGNHVFTLVSGGFSLIAFFLLVRKKTGWSIASAIIAALVWILWSTIFTHLEYGFINTLPFLLYTVIFSFYVIKKKTQRINS